MLLRYIVTAILVSFAAAECTRSYTVKKGDYCDKISAAQNVSTYQLLTVNKITDGCKSLVPDQVLCLGYKNEDCNKVHKVVKNDICEEIAADHGVNITTLYKNNPQIDAKCSNIYVDEVLCVDTKDIVKTPLDHLTMPSYPTSPTLAPPAATPPPTPTTTPPAVPTQTPKTDVKDHSSDSESGDGYDDDEDLPYCDE